MLAPPHATSTAPAPGPVGALADAEDEDEDDAEAAASESPALDDLLHPLSPNMATTRTASTILPWRLCVLAIASCRSGSIDPRK